MGLALDCLGEEVSGCVSTAFSSEKLIATQRDNKFVLMAMKAIIAVEIANPASICGASTPVTNCSDPNPIAYIEQKTTILAQSRADSCIVLLPGR